MNRNIPLTMLTGSESLCPLIVKSSITAEKRLREDIRAAWEAYEVDDSSDVGCVMSVHIFADGLTQVAKNKALCEYLDTGRLTTQI